MSAYVVDRATIDVLVQAAIDGAKNADGMPLGKRYQGESFGWWDPKLEQSVNVSEYASDAEALSGKLSPDMFGRLLWRENVASVAARYPGDASGDRPGPIDFCDEEAAEYTFTRRRAPMQAPTILGAIRCLEYQSCEHAGWHDSSAHAALLQLHRWISEQAIGRDCWGVSDDDVVKLEEEWRERRTLRVS